MFTHDWRQTRLRPLTWYAILALLGAVGCGSEDKLKTYPVTGKVIYKGRGEAALKLAGGYVILEPAPGTAAGPAQGQIEDDGTFALGSVVADVSVGGALPGEYRARVVPPKDRDSGKAPRGVLDPRYQKADTSGLRFTVVAGPNELTVEVEPTRR